MLDDARRVPAGTTLRADVCIVGAGAAGITIARELAGTSLSVCLIESGGLRLDPESQALNRGERSGFPYFDLDVSRLRFFGGTTNHWNGSCLPLDPIDFEARPWVPWSGWPFDREELDPYYVRAHAVCELGPFRYDRDAWETAERPAFPLRDGPVITAFNHNSPPTRFGHTYREEIEGAENIRGLLFANAVELELEASGREVRRVRVACLTGTEFHVSARCYVLATGTIENARLLLASNGVQPAGVGNGHGLVGRFFMEHLRVLGGLLLLTRPFRPGLYFDHERNGMRGKGYLALAEDVLRREQLLNVRAYVDPASANQGVRAASPSIVAATMAVRTGKPAREILQHLRSAFSELDDLAMYGYWRFFRLESRLDALHLVYHVEQAPDPESRIALTGERDSLGVPRVRLHWRFGERERRTLRRASEIIAREVGVAGLGRVRIIPDHPGTGWPPGLRGNWHQMGTTRMHADPARGVVDPACRVHGVQNLYVAGASVFPTAGYANPTLTLVALALRLSDHLRTRLAA